MNLYPGDDYWEIRKLGFSDLETREIYTACEVAMQEGYELSPVIAGKVVSRSAMNCREFVRQYIESMNEKYALIKSAINSKQVLNIYTHGGIRETCPHVLGYSGGKASVTFYQIGGNTQYFRSSWMTVFLEHIVSISSSSAVWITPHDYKTSPLAKEISDRREWV